MEIAFTKMHGLGNDFVVIDVTKQAITLTPRQIERIADRHLGVGCDQLLLVEPPKSSNADFGYRIYNSDGGEVGQCGNGARCFARFVREKGLSGNNEIRVDTLAGQLLLTFGENGDITVNMGVPRFRPAEIPLMADKQMLQYGVFIQGKQWNFAAVSMGNPHAVLRVDNVSKAPVNEVGAELESHPIFPEHANIGFMEVVDPHHIHLRVFERGVGETQACGSGACAATVAGIVNGWLKTPVRVDLNGGNLDIICNGVDQPVFMSGPATTVFEGTIDL